MIGDSVMGRRLSDNRLYVVTCICNLLCAIVISHVCKGDIDDDSDEVVEMIAG